MISAAIVGDGARVASLAAARAAVNAVDWRGRTALHYASERGHVECERILIDAGADPDVAEPSGKTARDLTKRRQSATTARVLRIWRRRRSERARRKKEALAAALDSAPWRPQASASTGATDV